MDFIKQAHIITVAIPVIS